MKRGVKGGSDRINRAEQRRWVVLGDTGRYVLGLDPVGRGRGQILLDPFETRSLSPAPIVQDEPQLAPSPQRPGSFRRGFQPANLSGILVGIRSCCSQNNPGLTHSFLLVLLQHLVVQKDQRRCEINQQLDKRTRHSLMMSQEVIL